MVRWTGLAVAVALALTGCKKKPPVSVAPVAEDALVTSLRTRVVPDPTQAKLSVKMRSKPLGIAAPPLNGGLVVDRPGKAYLAVLGPVGGPVLTLTSNGEGVAMMNARDRQWIVGDDAALQLGEATGGTVRMDDVVSLLLGLVPVTQEQVKGRTVEEGGVRLAIAGPGNTTLDALVDPTNATPKSVAVADAKGSTVLTATYAPFVLEGEAWLPTELVLFVPAVELTVTVRYKSWKTLETAPDVFSLEAPAGYQVVPLADYMRQMATQAPAPAE